MRDSSLQSDSELTQAVKNSDSLAFKTLFHRYYEPLFQFFWYRTRSYESAKDFVQEVFVRFWNNRENLDPGRSIKAYLYRIANNLFTDYLRKKSVEDAYLAEQAAHNFLSHPNEDFELREEIQSVLHVLPEELRTVFILNRYEGFKYAEIAESLDISIKTVESRMSKVLKLLRKKLRDYL